MNTIVINLGGEDYSIEYYFDIDGLLKLYSIQDLNGIEMIEKISDENYQEIEQIILEKWA